MTVFGASSFELSLVAWFLTVFSSLLINFSELAEAELISNLAEMRIKARRYRPFGRIDLWFRNYLSLCLLDPLASVAPQICVLPARTTFKLQASY